MLSIIYSVVCQQTVARIFVPDYPTGYRLNICLSSHLVSKIRLTLLVLNSSLSSSSSSACGNTTVRILRSDPSAAGADFGGCLCRVSRITGPADCILLLCERKLKGLYHDRG